MVEHQHVPGEGRWRATRRGVLVATGSTVLGAGLAGCGGDAGRAGSGYGAPPVTPRATSGPGGHELVALADVPVGGAVSAEDSGGNPVIVAQPRRGEVVAFSGVCTHRGCTVAPDGSELRCPCHGSTFDAMTGENTAGPAPEPLPPVEVSLVEGMVVQG